jgi:hypothetical protein
MRLSSRLISPLANSGVIRQKRAWENDQQDQVDADYEWHDAADSGSDRGGDAIDNDVDDIANNKGVT